MRWIAIVIAMVLPTLVSAQSPYVHGELVRAVHAKDKLWLLNDNGWLRALPDSGRVAETVKFDGLVVDVCRLNRSPVVATRRRDHIELMSLRKEIWRSLGKVAVAADEPVIGLACNDGKAVLLTGGHVTVAGSKSLRLAGKVPRGIRYSLFRQNGALLVGWNMGEWGGGLTQIDLASGAVEPVKGVGGPVNDIARMPGRPECLILAVGLVHFFPTGGLQQWCGDTAKPLFEAPFRIPGLDDQLRPDEKRSGTVAFFGLAAIPRGVVAVGLDGLRTVSAAGVGPVIPYPKTQRRGGESIVETDPDYRLIMSGINRRASVGVAMPIVAPN
jgi:hypothetical protein